MLKASKILAFQIKSKGLRDRIKYMKDHAVIGKFVGIWPSEKALIWWINNTWKPQGHYNLELGAKSFFIVIFLHQEDRNKIFEGRPYFFNAVGLYLRLWKERFKPDK